MKAARVGLAIALALAVQTYLARFVVSGGDLDDLAALTLTPPAHSSRDLSLSVTATSPAGGVASASFVVAVAAVADVSVW